MANNQPFIKDSIIQFENGTLTLSQIEAIFKSLPFNLTFIDADDNYLWSSRPSKDSFPAKLVDRHPDGAWSKYNEVLESLKAGNNHGSISGKNNEPINFYAVRNRNGEYLGALEIPGDLGSTIADEENEKPDTSTGASVTYDPETFVAPQYDKSPEQIKAEQEQPKEKPKEQRTLHADTATGPSDTHWLS
ncbi:hypothetical protein [Lentilactobacillus sp. Marseille-Q4993]|uniref:hypothetical protein n=1 Tax=Lentilactobacillus sp. Marseille-Q4993 TaxID=3039492 RepID=UPI0024BD3AE9|nr:hypothetical protein [Lentilactobacillus sp. Marseille-Q4993]